jgi:hypothetical protein
VEDVVAGAAAGPLAHEGDAFPSGVVVALKGCRRPDLVLGGPDDQQGSLGVLPDDVVITAVHRMPRLGAREPLVLR